MRFNWFFKRVKAQVFNKKTMLFVLVIWILTGCGLNIGEKPWFSENRVYEWLPPSSQCGTVNYKKTFVDFFTRENGEAPALLDSMKTAVLCLKGKVVEYKKLIRGAHEDYLTQPELKNLLNHEVVKTGIEDWIDGVTKDKNFNLFIGFKDMTLRIHDLFRPEAPAQEQSVQNSLSETVCSNEPKEIALYKKEVDQLSELLDLMNEWLRSIHVSSKQLALKLNGYVASEKLTHFFQKNWPEKELDEAVEDLFQNNLDQMDPDLRRKYLSERNAQVMRRHFQTIQSQLNYPAGAISGTEGLEHPLTSSQDEKSVIKAGEKNTDKTGNQVSSPADFFRYLQEHPKTALSIPEIRRAALLSVLTDEANLIDLPGFSGYLAEKERDISAIKRKREQAEWLEKEWWHFGLPDVEKERNEMLDHLYTMTEISGKLVSSPSHITGLDMKYLLLNARLVEMIMNVYDFNGNGSVERRELDSVYCLFNSLLLSIIPDSPGEKGWWEQWKRDVSSSGNIFNYILKYQDIPEESSSLEDLDIHFVWTSSSGGLNDEDISLSRKDLVKLVFVLFREFFPERYFTTDASSEQN